MTKLSANDSHTQRNMTARKNTKKEYKTYKIIKTYNTNANIKIIREKEKKTIDLQNHSSSKF